MTRLLPILLTTTIAINSIGQGMSTYLKENAVCIGNPDSLSQQVYDCLADYRLIMVGEMHGTNEPAEFLTGLAELFARNGDSVQVGFEIPPNEMVGLSTQTAESSIFKTNFFTGISTDGRASVAWANAISRLVKNSKIHVYFFDIEKSENIDAQDRDSMMYIKIKNQIAQHPSWRNLTLSGNIHNMLLPRKGKAKTGLFLSKDPNLNLSSHICSFNHFYQGGTMFNNIGNGLEVHQIPYSDSSYSRFTECGDNYLFLNPKNDENIYTGVFFTKKVTAAQLANKH